MCVNNVISNKLTQLLKRVKFYKRLKYIFWNNHIVIKIIDNIYLAIKKKEEYKSLQKLDISLIVWYYITQ